MKKKLLIILFCGLLSFVLGNRNLVIAQAPAPAKLEPVASFGHSMAIGLSVTSGNRIFVSFPNFDGSGKYALAEIIKGQLQAYPDKTWNDRSSATNKHFVRVQDLYVDDQDFLWVLDSKPAPGRDLFKSSASDQPLGRFELIKIDTKSDKVVGSYDFPDLDKANSALNDVRVDTKKQVAYLSDPGQAAIVVLDLQNGRSRTLLAKTRFTTADTITLRYSGQEMVDVKGRPFKSNINGIALTHDGRYLYFKPINKSTLFKIETRYLRDIWLSSEELEGKVEEAGNVGITHGLLADAKGNIYLTNSEHYAISYLTPDGQLKELVKDKDLLWPDSMGIGGDGYLYISVSQLQLLPAWNKGKDKTVYPYRAYRVKLPD